MKSPNKRSLFRINKYQSEIFFISLVPALILAILLTLHLRFFHGKLLDVLLYGTFEESLKFINNMTLFILMVIWVFFIFVTVWAYFVSKNTLGSFPRIIKELEEINLKKEVKYLRARPDDKLATELLKRINILIKNSKTAGKE